jgi:hypothetical protein
MTCVQEGFSKSVERQVTHYDPYRLVQVGFMVRVCTRVGGRVFILTVLHVAVCSNDDIKSTMKH